MAADQIHIDWPRIGDTLYFTIETDSNTIWNGTILTTFVVANFGDYDVAMAETPASSCHYVGTFPVIAAGWYIVRIRYRVGGSPAVTDPVIGEDLIYWSGTLIERGANVTRINSNSAAAVTAALYWGNVETGTAQSGAAGTITLAAGESAVDDFFNGAVIYLTGGTGIGQYRKITDYVGSTKVATIDTNWVTNPDATSTYLITGRIT